MAEAALAGLRVLEIGGGLPTAYCCKLLADLGADVIKVEPLTGDPLRHLPPFPKDVPHLETGGLHLLLDTSKRSIAVDLEQPCGQEIVRKCAHAAELIVESLPPGRMAALGLGYDALAKDHKDLVMVSVSPFGQTGPHRDYKATEIVSFGMSSHMYYSGKENRPPLKYQGYKGGFLAGSQAAVASLGASLAAKLQGEGQWVDVSIQETLLGPDGETKLVRYSHLGGVDEATRRSNTAQTGRVAGVFPCKDGFVQFNADGRMWPRIAQMLEMPELATNPRFQTNDGRRDNWQEFEAVFYAWLSDHTMIEIVMTAQAARVPAVPVYTIDQIPQDPQLVARGFFETVDHPLTGLLSYPGSPFKMSATPYRMSRAPLLGEHTEAILTGELRYSVSDVAAFTKERVIAQAVAPSAHPVGRAK